MEKVAITSAKNECRYLLEWVAYHRIIGFENILIIMNDNDDQTTTFLSKMERAGFLTFIEHKVPEHKTPLIEAWRIAKAHLDGECYNGWALVCDADEFLDLGEHKTVGEFVSKFEDCDSISINWRIYGSSGFLQKPTGIVIENYTYCARESFSLHREFKSLFRVGPNLKRFNSHYPLFLNEDARYVYSTGEEMDRLVLKSRPYWKAAKNAHDSVRINHYVVKSKEEYLRKAARGRGAKSKASSEYNSRYTEEFFRKMDLNDERVHTLGGRVPSVKKEMRRMFQRSGLEGSFSLQYFGLVEDNEIAGASAAGEVAVKSM